MFKNLSVCGHYWFIVVIGSNHPA